MERSFQPSLGVQVSDGISPLIEDGAQYETKKIVAYAVEEGADWLVISVTKRYF
jgi:hypothetical protein